MVNISNIQKYRIFRGRLKDSTHKKYIILLCFGMSNIENAIVQYHFLFKYLEFYEELRNELS